MNNRQLWQQARLQNLDDLVGNVDALAELKEVQSGFALLYGPMGTGKTSLALAYAFERTGLRIEEESFKYNPGESFAIHMHAQNFDLEDVLQKRTFFGRGIRTVVVVDEAQDLQPTRQQSRLKTWPVRDDLTLLLCTTNPEKLDTAIQDRCAKIRLGPLAAREIPVLVERACRLRGIAVPEGLSAALNRSGVSRPRAIYNAVDAVARGKSVIEAVTGQKI